MYREFSAICFFMLISLAVFAQENGLIEGKVINKSDGTPIIGARIRIGNINTQSDAEGNFKVNTRLDEAVLFISYLGYLGQMMKISLPMVSPLP